MSSATPKKRRPKGTGSIFKNGSRFRAQFVSPNNGQKYSESFDTEEQAESYLREVIAKTYGGQTPGLASELPENLTVREFFLIWVEFKYKEKQPLTPVRENTIGGYEQSLRDWVIPFLGDMNLMRLHADNISAWLAWMAETPSKKTGEPLGQHGQRNAWIVVKQAMKWGVHESILPSNPIGSLKGIANPIDRPKDRAMEKKDYKKFTAFLKSKGCNHKEGYCELRWALGYVLAKRQSEVMALKWPHVHLRGKEPHIELREHLVVRKWKHGCDSTNPCGRSQGGHCPKKHSGGMLILPGSKTGEDELPPRFPLTDELVQLFKAHKVLTDAERLEAKKNGTADYANLKLMNHENLVFHHWKRLNPSTTSMDYHRFQTVAAEAGLSKDYRLHDLRHTAVTYIVEASGGNTGLAQIIANHKTPLTTAKYSHPSLTATKKALEATTLMLNESDDDEAHETGK